MGNLQWEIQFFRLAAAFIASPSQIKWILTSQGMEKIKYDKHYQNEITVCLNLSY